jgi:Domain of unknown function (DUF4394)
MRRALPLIALAAALLAPSAAQADRALMLTTGAQIISFDTGNPGPSASTIAVTGIPPDETLRGIDFRPADGQLYGWSVLTGLEDTIRTYKIDPASGAATFVGKSVFKAEDVAAAFGFDPVIDRVRYINTKDRSLRLKPDGSNAGGDSLSGASEPDLIALGYDRSFVGATLTTAFAIDRTESRLDRIGGVDGFPSLNLGGVTPIGPLGFTLKAVDGGFDVSADGRAFAALTDAADSVTRLYDVNLTTGGAGAIGPIGAGNQEAFSLALVPGTEGLPDKKPPAGLIDIPPTLKLGKLRSSKIKFKFSSSEACAASAKLVVKKTEVAAGSATLSAAGVAQIKLTATKAGKKLLAGKHRAGAKLTLTLTDTTGNVGSVTQKLALR